MSTKSTIIFPEAFEPFWGEDQAEMLHEVLPAYPASIQESIHQLGVRALGAPGAVDGSEITVAIRTLNEADMLQKALFSVRRQTIGERVDIVVIDNESTDGTRSVAEEWGARVVTLPREGFSYPGSMNACMEASTTNLVFMTVGHAALVSEVALESAVKRFKTEEHLGGIFCQPLPSSMASKTELLFANLGNPFLNKEIHEIRKAVMGVMGSTNAVFRRDIWESLSRFDTSYGMGGEDTQFAGRMLESGYRIVRDPVLSVAHSHNLGPKDYARQFIAWSKMAKGTKEPFDLDKVLSRRPDLRRRMAKP